ncbi:MAG: transglycosylase SLT domain-containing protein, partial [Alphaproteobacteria bacterium]|nr:transglycosylase SLT domain-containing protein [Alphaproteobacteria bacterium]
GLRKIVAPDGTITGWARHSGGQLSFGEAIEKLFTYLAASLSDDNVQAHMLLELFYPKEPKHKDYNDKIAGGDPGPASQAADTQKAALKKVVEDKNHPDRQLSTAEFTTKFFPHITNPEGETLLRPELLEKLEEKGPTTFKNHVNMAIAAVKEYNDNLSEGQIKLDTNLFLNQIYRESAFDANAIGKETRWGRARGMGQMIESVGEKYGLSSANNYADYFNPEKSLRAAVEHVGDLTQKYKSQRLATIAYNGGEGALRKIARALDKPVSELKSEEWIAYTDEQNQRLGKGDDDSWREQTNKYLKETAPEYWSDEQRQTAIAKMEDLGLIKPEPEPPTQVASTPPSPIKT